MTRTSTFSFPFVLFWTCCFGWSQALPPAPGPYVPLSATQTSSLSSYGPQDRLVATYYFYWYKWGDACVGKVCNPTYSRSHIEFATGVFDASRSRDALTDHPLDLDKTDFGDPQWHRAQIERIIAAGIDLILPV